MLGGRQEESGCDLDAAMVRTIAAGSQQRTIASINDRIATLTSTPAIAARKTIGPRAASTRLRSATRPAQCR